MTHYSDQSHVSLHGYSSDILAKAIEMPEFRVLFLEFVPSLTTFIVMIVISI